MALPPCVCMCVWAACISMNVRAACVAQHDCPHAHGANTDLAHGAHHMNTYGCRSAPDADIHAGNRSKGGGQGAPRLDVLDKWAQSKALPPIEVSCRVYAAAPTCWGHNGRVHVHVHASNPPCRQPPQCWRRPNGRTDQLCCSNHMLAVHGARTLIHALRAAGACVRACLGGRTTAARERPDGRCPSRPHAPTCGALSASRQLQRAP